MRKEHPSAEDARHVLLCLHEVRLDDTINNGQKFKRQDECFARRTGGEVTWVSSGYTCRRPRPGALLRSLQEAPADDSSTDGALEPGIIAPEGTPGSGDGAVPFVADSPPAENLLLTIPDGPMRHNKALYDAGYEAAVTAVTRLVAAAENAATSEDETVTTKMVMPPTGTKRTYYSLDTYAWPSNGNHTDLETPWVARDGYMNVKRLEIAPDPKYLNNIIRCVGDLGRAYYFTGELRYAERLVQKVRTFFLDEETGMLPSLAYAGMRPGVDKVGRPTGNINFRNIGDVLDGIYLVRKSGAWSEGDEAAWRKWLEEYKEYLESKPVGPERCSMCNHGLYYDMQMLAVMRYLGRSEELREYLRDLVEPRLRIQVRGGMLPNELMRPTSLFYVNFVAEGFVRMAALVQLEGVDYWRWDAAKGNSALDIWDWAMSFWCDEGAAWILPQKSDMRLGIDPGAAIFTGFPYTAATPRGRRSERSAVYERGLRAVTAEDMVTKRGAAMLTSARLDSCLFRECGTDDLSPDNPATWAGHCASLDGVAHVQTTSIDFTTPGPAGREAEERGDTVAGSMRGGGGAKPSKSVRATPMVPPDSGQADVQAPPQVHDGGEGRGDVPRAVRDSQTRGGGSSRSYVAEPHPALRAPGRRPAPIDGPPTEMQETGLRSQGAVQLFSTTAGDKAMNAVPMTLSALVLVLFVALITRLTLRPRKERPRFA